MSPPASTVAGRAPRGRWATDRAPALATEDQEARWRLLDRSRGDLVAHRARLVTAPTTLDAVRAATVIRQAASAASLGAAADARASARSRRE